MPYAFIFRFQLVFLSPLPRCRLCRRYVFRISLPLSLPPFFHWFFIISPLFFFVISRYATPLRHILIFFDISFSFHIAAFISLSIRHDADIATIDAAFSAATADAFILPAIFDDAGFLRWPSPMAAEPFFRGCIDG